MIYLDPRAGSKELLVPLRTLGMKVHVERMSFGDAAFIGKGEGGAPVPVGIEYKKLGDLLQCMGDDRFTRHQLPGMRDCYEDIWLIIEGEWKPRNDGLLQVRRGRKWGMLPGDGRRQIRYGRLMKWLISLEVRGGVRVIRTTSRGETAEVITALYQWWTFAPLEHHKSHVQSSMKRGFTDHVGFLPPLEEVKMVAQVAGMGRAKAEAILSHFGSIADAIDGSLLQWGNVPGVGPVLRERFLDVLTRQYKGAKHARSRKKKINRPA